MDRSPGGHDGVGGPASAAPVGQIADRGRHGAGPCDGDIRPEGGLQQVLLSVGGDELLALLHHHGTKSRFGENAAQSHTAAADALDPAAERLNSA